VIDAKLYSHQGNSGFDDVGVEPGLLPLPLHGSKVKCAVKETEQETSCGRG